MLTRQDILAFFKMHPDATSKDLGRQFSISPSAAAARAKQMIDGGFLTRIVVGRTLSKIDIYGYRVNVAATSDMSKKDRVKTTVREGLDNGKTLHPSGDITALISNLSQALAKQIASQVVVDLQGQLQRELSAIIPPNVTVPKLALDFIPPPHKPEVLTHKPKLPRVGVTNLLPQQAGMIQQEFCDTFDLTFWNGKTGDGTGSLKAMGVRCEAVFHHVEHSGHDVEETLRSVGAKIIRVPGGMSTLRDALTKYYVEAVK